MIDQLRYNIKNYENLSISIYLSFYYKKKPNKYNANMILIKFDYVIKIMEFEDYKENYFYIY